ncbi:hypothetical protein DEAC_c31100 [Desulfosporosinus acididurans]|uniref:Uncharacterized protein n=1 Tax=Desulfosporosinus acididurans TaxID=476652 RepID=A0A0J1FQ98_9FIRM|nr:hypothetical protein [Desulfosporosinus acididurans]KLU65143.1 hypothetical protein DEAC_c31100 [Desulfosporosinus acididurans]
MNNNSDNLVSTEICGSQNTQSQSINKIIPINDSAKMGRMNLDSLFNGLVGLQTVKNEFYKLSRLIKNMEIRNEMLGLNDRVNYNLLLEGVLDRFACI